MGRTNKDRHHNDDDFLDLEPDFDDFEVELELLAPKKKRSNAKKKKKPIQRPLNWEDDWVDPADDIMYGFSK